jgi:DNA-binding Lrp family transcriptional regulator
MVILPALRMFKIDARFDMIGDDIEPMTENQRVEWISEIRAEQLSGLEVAMVQELQRDLYLTERPFTPMSERLKIDVAELLRVAREFLDNGTMRRYGAVLNHRQAGFTANALGCWIVPPSRIEEVGKSMACLPEVTHCYERQTYADWPYNLFTMIHGRTREECETIAGEMSSQMGVADYILLYSTKEYKKERVQYFA